VASAGDARGRARGSGRHRSSRLRAAFAFAVALAGIAATASAATLNVPGTYATVQAAVAAAAPGDVVLIAPGTYVLGSTITANVSNLTIQGSGSASTTLQGSSAIGNAIHVTADGTTIRDLAVQSTDLTSGHELILVGANNVTIRDCEIYGVDPGMSWNASGLVIRGMDVQGGLTGLVLLNNNIHTLRQPAYINPGTVGSVTNNHVSGTKGWVVDGATLTFTGNSWGPPENQSAEIALLASCTPAQYPNLLALSAANGNAYISRR
jgi:hypothetical protein